MSCQRRFAVLYAETLVVICPRCGAHVDEPVSGSTVWQPDDIRREADEAPQRTCRECAHSFKIVFFNRVTVNPDPENAQ